MKAKEEYHACGGTPLGAGLDLYEIPQLAFAPIPVKRAPYSGGGDGHVNKLHLFPVPF